MDKTSRRLDRYEKVSLRQRFGAVVLNVIRLRGDQLLGKMGELPWKTMQETARRFS